MPYPAPPPQAVAPVPGPSPSLPVAPSPVPSQAPVREPIQAPREPQQEVAAQSSPVVLKPEPRQLPARAHASEVVAKQMPEPSPKADTRRQHKSTMPRHPHKPSLVSRFFMLALFLIAAVALVWGVRKVLKQKPDMDSGPRPAPIRKETSADPGKVNSTTRSDPSVISIPTPKPDQPVLIEPPPSPPGGVDAKAPAMEALAVLEKFVNAKTLAERLPLIETKLSETELASTCIAGPLPAATNMVFDFRSSIPIEEVVDFYYNVDFSSQTNHPNPQTVLLRTRGTGIPKVVVEPFLDLYGGRLADYAAKPTEKGGNFRVIADAVASCADPKIPNREKKLTLKLYARENNKEIAQAYFSRVSKIGEMLQNESLSPDSERRLSYGKATRCTVMLRWNVEENPQQPYLEALAIKSLDWSP
jgi:hypothetical protein